MNDTVLCTIIYGLWLCKMQSHSFLNCLLICSTPRQVEDKSCLKSRISRSLAYHPSSCGLPGFTENLKELECNTRLLLWQHADGIRNDKVASFCCTLCDICFAQEEEPILQIHAPSPEQWWIICTYDMSDM